MKSVTFSYSIDNGASWSTEYALDALYFWCDLNPEFETSGSESRRMGNTAPVCQKPTARLKLDLELSWKNFNPAEFATAQDAHDRWKFMQYWLCAPLRRIWYTGGSAHFAWTDFDAQDNENYVNVDNWDYNYEKAEQAANERKIRSITLNLMGRNAKPVVLM